MSNNPPEDHGKARRGPAFRVSDPGHVAAHMNAKDKTGTTLHQMAFFTKVEYWVLRRLEAEGQKMADEVKARLERLDAVIDNHRNSIPPDNPAFVQILSWLDIAQQTYTVEFLQSCQPGFFQQLVAFCHSQRLNDPNADLFLKRLEVLMRTTLLNRICSKENVEYVLSILQPTS